MASKPQDQLPANPWITDDGSPLRGFYWMRADPKPAQESVWMPTALLNPVAGGPCGDSYLSITRIKTSDLARDGSKDIFRQRISESKRTFMWDCRFPGPPGPMPFRLTVEMMPVPDPPAAVYTRTVHHGYLVSRLKGKT